MQNMEETIRTLLNRNKRVEAEKAWELSITRRAFLAILTYSTAAMLLWLLGEERFLLLSFIPAVSYVFSTLSLPQVKRWWLRNRL